MLIETGFKNSQTLMPDVLIGEQPPQSLKLFHPTYRLQNQPRSVTFFIRIQL